MVFRNALSDFDEAKVNVVVADDIEAVFFIHREGVSVDIGLGLFFGDLDGVGDVKVR